MRGPAPGVEGVRTDVTGPLAGRAPEEVAARERGGADGGAAEVAGLAVAAVDVHLAAVVVDARRAAHGLGGVLGANGVDAAGADALAHQGDEVGPDGVPLGAG